MGSNRVLRGFLDKTVSSIDIEVLKNCKTSQRTNGTVFLDTGNITFLLYQNSFIISHHTFIKELDVRLYEGRLRITFNHHIETELPYNEIKNKTDLFNYMVQQDTPFTFEDIEKIRDIISVLTDRFYSWWWK